MGDFDFVALITFIIGVFLLYFGFLILFIYIRAGLKKGFFFVVNVEEPMLKNPFRIVIFSLAVIFFATIMMMPFFEKDLIYIFRWLGYV